MSLRDSVKLAAVLGLGMVATTALAEDLAQRSGLYLAGTAGYTIPSDPDVQVGDAGLDGKLGLDDGIAGTVALGTYLGAFRIEVEGAYRYNELSSDQTGSLGLGTLDGHLQSGSGMVNGFFDIPLGDRMQIYVGGGAGAAWVQGDVDVEFANIQTISGTQDDWVFAYQFMAGVAFDLSDKLALTIGYRYWATDDLSFDQISVDGLQFHAVEAGLRYHF